MRPSQHPHSWYGRNQDDAAPRHDDTASLPGAGQPGPAHEAARLRQENAQLRRALRTRPVIDMARGILMASLACSHEEAWQILVTVSQHSNTKLHRVADALVAAATGAEPMPEVLRHHLSAALETRQAAPEAQRRT
ncbi:ANTAR domain-containing protein [Streptomyces sp. NPDC005476]|uniref:ANTAR domain-containing response regulator n=1 Tax=Streptomyces sp. NPDC005476 TaxID=3156882 RepID=UPI003454A6DE